jgi:hypothetical protein
MNKETKCTCERPDDNTCDYCEQQSSIQILKEAAEDYGNSIGNKDGTSFDWGGPEREESFNLYYNLGKEMREYVNNLYLLLPSEYIINWESSFSSLVGDNLLPVSISFDNYIQKN